LIYISAIFSGIFLIFWRKIIMMVEGGLQKCPGILQERLRVLQERLEPGL
jgi:hypothetical protein